MHDDKFTKGMRGEYRGDFTRDTFDPLRHFSRVLIQQGRVQLDADNNESDSIHLHHLRTLGADLMGPHAAPMASDGTPGEGFKITLDAETFSIAAGHYYVNGILCENENDDTTYLNQPDWPLTDDEKKAPLPKEPYLVYLDVWERHISYVEDDYIREKALAGVDTATRAQIVWQVKVLSHSQFKELDVEIDDIKNDYEQFLDILRFVKVLKPGNGRLRARARRSADKSNDPCLTSPEASYRGAENQLYRVEIHYDGGADGYRSATFKWSRNNASDIYKITAPAINNSTITLQHLGRDSRCSLQPNDWVEIVDDDSTLRNRADALLQIEEVDPENFQVILKNPSATALQFDLDKHPYLRRWDQTGDALANGIPVSAGSDWILLEDGVEIQFPIAGNKPGPAPKPTPKPKPELEITEDVDDQIYQTGDYWLIPARTATGDVEWPGTQENPDALPPHGVKHHYAPLAAIDTGAKKAKAKTKTKTKITDKEKEKEKVKATEETDLRRRLVNLWK